MATTRRRPPADTTLEQTIIDAYLAGDTAPTIATRHGVTPKRIRAILDRHGIPRRDDRAGHTGGANKLTLTPTLLDQIRNRYHAGESIADLAAATGHGRRQITTALHAAGATIRPPAHARGTVVTPETAEAVTTEYLAGESSLGAIGLRHQLRAARVRDIIRQAGHPIRRRGASQAIARRLLTLDTTAYDVKAWGRDQGLIDHIPKACPPNWLIDVYTAAHPTGGEP